MFRRNYWLHFLLLTGVLLPGRFALLQAWTLHPVEGRDYVPLAEVGAFYDFAPGSIQVSSEAVHMVRPDQSFTARIGTRELVLNNLRFHLSLPVVRHEGLEMVSRLDLAKTIDPVLRPTLIEGETIRTVVLDAGHGGNDHGTSSYYGSEKLYTLDVVRRLAPLLRARGLNVVLTRASDVYIALEERVVLANRSAEALFVSVHFNAGALTRGIETFALTPHGVPSSDQKPSLADLQPASGNERDLENIALATAIHGCIMRRIRLPDRGIRRARFHVLKDIQMPAVLIEGGYLGGQDAFSIAHGQYRQVLAESIAAGIFRYIAVVPEARPALTTAHSALVQTDTHVPKP